MTESHWVRLFVNKLFELGVRADLALVAALAHEVYESFSANDPVEVAQATWDSWPPHDD